MTMDEAGQEGERQAADIDTEEGQREYAAWRKASVQPLMVPPLDPDAAAATRRAQEAEQARWATERTAERDERLRTAALHGALMCEYAGLKDVEAVLDAAARLRIFLSGEPDPAAVGPQPN